MEHGRLDGERNRLPRRLEDLMEGPMLVLGFAWLALLVLELAGRLTPALAGGIHALSANFARRGTGYVASLTLLVTVAGAAGMLAFEKDVPDSRIVDYGSALWWTAMVMTTMGSEYWPRSAEGRALCLALSLYAFAMFGYVTATIAGFFLGRDAQRASREPTALNRLGTLAREIAALRAEVEAIRFARKQAGRTPGRRTPGP